MRKRQEHRIGKVTFDEMFPHRKDGLCRCNCGQQARRSWASSACNREAYEAYALKKGFSAQIRKVVFARDRGVCRDCGMDTEKDRMDCHMANVNRLPEAERRIKRAEFIARGFPTPYRSWWQADHINPLIEGGAHDLENLRTLCIPCHKARTKALASKRAKRQ